MTAAVIFSRVLGIVSLIEFSIMGMFWLFDVQDNFLSSLLDPLLLGTFSFPFLYIWVIRPIKQQFSVQLDEIEKKDEALRQANLHLAQEVENEISKNREKEQLLIQQSKMAEMGTMVGAIAHQWKQPLNALNLILCDVEDSYQHNELNRERIEEIVASGMEQIKFMSKTVDDFRDFFRVSSEPCVFSVVDAVKETCSLLSPQFSQSGIEVDVEVSGDAVNLKTTGYPNEFKQVIFNVVNNAREAICEQKAKGTLGREGKVSVFISLEGQFVVVRIRDNGGGVPDHVMEKIFAPYFSTKGEQGTGIGLYLAKVIIEKRMCGELRMSNCNDGAEFHVLVKSAK